MCKPPVNQKLLLGSTRNSQGTLVGSSAQVFQGKIEEPTVYAFALGPADLDFAANDVISRADFIDDTRKELMTAIDNLSTDLNIRISDLEEALNDKAEDLNKKKVDRSQLGNLLIQLGENVKSKV